MNITPTPIEGLLEVQPTRFPDKRGWFTELYKETALKEISPSLIFVQDNISFSQKGVVRGLHLQLAPFQQGKLVAVLRGKVLDVVVDLRRGSRTFGQIHTCMLEGEKLNMLVIPEGFAHGFAALEDSYFYYKCTNVYNPASETGIRWDDPDLKINWLIRNPMLSDKDLQLPTLNELLIKSVISHH